MNFFERTISPTAPKDPLEGSIKLLLLSNIITITMTLNCNFEDENEALATNLAVNMIHLSALVLGFSWGAFNWCTDHGHQVNPENQAINNRRFQV